MPPEFRPTRYLTVAGVLSPDGRLLLHRGFVIDTPMMGTEMVDSPLEIELIDAEGRVSYRGPVSVESPVTQRRGSPREPTIQRSGYLAVVDTVPFPEGTRKVAFLWRGSPIHEFTVPREGPRVELHWQPGRNVAGRHRLTWTAEPFEGNELSFLVAYSNDHGKTWRPLALPIEANELEVDFDALPGGEGQLRILATDGGNTTVEETPPFSVLEKGVVTTILAPADASSLPENVPAFFLGQGLNAETQQLENETLRWTSSEDGVLGVGAFVQTMLSPGRHRITLTAATALREQESTIVVDVGAAY